MKKIIILLLFVVSCKESIGQCMVRETRERTECHTVEQVLKCGEDECRVILETGERVTAYFITVPGDRVVQNKEFRNVRLDNRLCPQR
jgi:hypothetical protein